MDDHSTANDLRRILGNTIAELGRVKSQRDELLTILRQINAGRYIDGDKPLLYAVEVALAKLGKEGE